MSWTWAVRMEHTHTHTHMAAAFDHHYFDFPFHGLFHGGMHSVCLHMATHMQNMTCPRLRVQATVGYWPDRQGCLCDCIAGLLCCWLPLLPLCVVVL